eukprot:scaffold50928_cov56-Cyclotella_meneghiniana.AAC.1
MKWNTSSLSSRSVQHYLTCARSTRRNNFIKARTSYGAIAISITRSITTTFCLPVDHHRPPPAALVSPLARNSVIVARRYFGQRPWIAKNSNSIQEILDTANMQIESAELTAANLAAVWSTIPRLLSKEDVGKLLSNQKDDDDDAIIQCEDQIFNILELVIHSLDAFNPREITTIILGMAKIVHNVRYAKQQKNERDMNIYQCAFGNVLDEGNYRDSIFHPLAESANYILADYEPRYLSNLAYAFALLGYNPKFDDGSTLLTNIADSSIACIEEFNEQDISNTVWAYAKLEVTHSPLFQAIGDVVVKNQNLESFTPQELSNTVWAYAKANEMHPGLFDRLGNAFVARDLESFIPQHLANTVWAYATSNIQYPELFKRVGDAIVKQDDLTSFTPQNIANVVWAYATANERHHELFHKLG